MNGSRKQKEDTIREGGCLCGAVRYRAVGHPIHPSICHCRSCQLATGAAGVAWVAFKRSGWSVVLGEPAEVNSSPGVTRTFCSSCGSALTYARDALAEYTDVTVATFDSSVGLEPQCHIFVADKPDWVKLNDGLPQFKAWRTQSQSKSEPESD